MLMFSCSGIRQIKHNVTIFKLHSSPWWECECVHIYMCYISSFENQLILRQDLIWERKKKTEKSCNTFCELHSPQGIYHKNVLCFWLHHSDSQDGKQLRWEIVRNNLKRKLWFNSIWMSTIKTEESLHEQMFKLQGKNNQRTGYSYVLA